MPGIRAAGSCAVQRAAVYQRRRPERSVAYQVVQQNLETWLARRLAGGLDAGADLIDVVSAPDRNVYKTLEEAKSNRYYGPKSPGNRGTIPVR